MCSVLTPGPFIILNKSQYVFHSRVQSDELTD